MHNGDAACEAGGIACLSEPAVLRSTSVALIAAQMMMALADVLAARVGAA